jgi:transcriptional regulator with XRE-family HTH domain
MHEFYNRVRTIMDRSGTNRRQFCEKYQYNYRTLQAYWDTDRLPPGNVLQDLAREYNVSLDTLVFGAREPSSYDPVVQRILRFLAQQDEQNLLRIEGALKMLQYMNLAGPEDAANRLESLTDLLTGISRLVQEGDFTPEQKEFGREMLNRLVLNLFERKVPIEDEWAELEEIGP